VSPGGRGQFDVIAGGAVVFSKQRAGRFPTPGETLELVTPA
jgi:predicted Rdx family selenoprotein